MLFSSCNYNSTYAFATNTMSYITTAITSTSFGATAITSTNTGAVMLLHVVVMVQVVLGK